MHNGAVVPVHVEQAEPQWLGSSVGQTAQVPALHQEPDAQSVFFAHCSQLPARQFGVLPPHATQALPQCAASASLQVSHAPALHHAPLPHCASNAHSAHEPP